MSYEYDSTVIPSLPNTYDVPESPTDLQLLEQIIHNQETELQFYYYELNKSKDTVEDLTEQNQALHNDNLLIVEKLENLVDQGSTGSSTLQDSNTQILAKLDQLQVGSNTVTTYGVLYIPLAVIVFMLWRFFSEFLRPLR